MVPMREVKPRHIHAGLDERADHLRGLTGRSDSGNDLSAPDHEGAQYSTASILVWKSQSRTYDWYASPTKGATMNLGSKSEV